MVTAVIDAVCPTSPRSTSVNVTWIGAGSVNVAVVTCSLNDVAAIASITGASLVPVTVIVTVCVSVAELESVIATLYFSVTTSPTAR